MATSAGELPSGWEQRQYEPRQRPYFVNHNTRTTTWLDPRRQQSLSQSILDDDIPQYTREFKKKVDDFRSQPDMFCRSGECHVKVRRTHIFDDSYRVIMAKSVADLKKRLVIEFAGEAGIDQGGLSREFFSLLPRELFNPSYALFSAGENYAFQINPHSGINSEHLHYFKFIGRVVSLAIFHNHFLDAFFVSVIYKMILRKKISLADMASVDIVIYNSLTHMRDNDIGNSGLDFSVDEDFFGQEVTTNLKPNGSEINVTNDNIMEYIDLLTEWMLQERVKEQSSAFIAGFNELIPPDLVKNFHECELELLISGTADIDVDDWEKHTDYYGYSASDGVIQNFWRCIRSWDSEQKSRLLQFVTGTSRIPITGFADLRGDNQPRRFRIEKGGGKLPGSHTCFNRLDLPPYETYDELCRMLKTAMDETVGFGQV